MTFSESFHSLERTVSREPISTRQGEMIIHRSKPFPNGTCQNYSLKVISAGTIVGDHIEIYKPGAVTIIVNS